MFELNNYLKSLPQDYKADHGFKDWLHDVTDIDTMRNIIMTAEKRIKRIVGHRDVCLPHIDEKTLPLCADRRAAHERHLLSGACSVDHMYK